MLTDSAIVAAVIVGTLGLAAAIVAVVPQAGRLRRLERVVTIIEKIEEPYAREPLVALRDRLIDRYRPLSAGVWAARVGLALNVVGLTAVFTSSWVRSFAPSFVPDLVLVVAFVLVMSGAALVLWTTVRDVRAWLVRRRARAAATEQPSRALPEPSPDATSPRPARSARPPRSKRPQSD